jgi:hypothetical protein
MRDDEEFWLALVRLTGSNLAVEGFAHIEDLIVDNRLDEQTLHRLHGALRSLSQRSLEKARELEAKRKRPWEFKNDR